MFVRMDRRLSMQLCAVALSVTVLATGCASAPPHNTRSLFAPVPVFDGHSDVAIHYARTKPPWSLLEHDFATKLPGQSDLPRWRAGGVTGALVTVSSDLEGSGQHFDRLLASLDWFDALVGRHFFDLAKVGSASELRLARLRGRIALIPAVEGGEQIDGSIANLRTTYARGVRSMLIVYDHHNNLGDGAMVLEQSAALASSPQAEA